MNECICFWCGEEHQGRGYRWCGECWHLYPTARSLRRAMRRPYLHRLWGLQRPFLKGNDLENGWFYDLWAALTIRVSRIYFCPLCSHDF